MLLFQHSSTPESTPPPPTSAEPPTNFCNAAALPLMLVFCRSHTAKQSTTNTANDRCSYTLCEANPEENAELVRKVQPRQAAHKPASAQSRAAQCAIGGAHFCLRWLHSRKESSSSSGTAITSSSRKTTAAANSDCQEPQKARVSGHPCGQAAALPYVVFRRLARDGLSQEQHFVAA
jgi:hypothetical protein